MCVLAPQVSLDKIAHPAILAVHGREDGVQVKVLLLRRINQDLGPGTWWQEQQQPPYRQQTRMMSAWEDGMLHE